MFATAAPSNNKASTDGGSPTHSWFTKLECKHFFQNVVNPELIDKEKSELVDTEKSELIDTEKSKLIDTEKSELCRTRRRHNISYEEQANIK